MHEYRISRSSILGQWGSRSKVLMTKYLNILQLEKIQFFYQKWNLFIHRPALQTWILITITIFAGHFCPPIRFQPSKSMRILSRINNTERNSFFCYCVHIWETLPLKSAINCRGNLKALVLFKEIPKTLWYLHCQHAARLHTKCYVCYCTYMCNKQNICWRKNVTAWRPLIAFATR
jgi:hypothetical protein